MKVKKSDSEKASFKRQRGRSSPLREEMTKIFAEDKSPIKASVVRKKLTEREVRFARNQFWRILGRLEGKGTIKRVGVGTYQYANGAS